MSCDSRMFITKQAENHFNPFTAVPFFGFMKLDSRFRKSIAKTIPKTSTLIRVINKFAVMEKVVELIKAVCFFRYLRTAE